MPIQLASPVPANYEWIGILVGVLAAALLFVLLAAGLKTWLASSSTMGAASSEMYIVGGGGAQYAVPSPPKAGVSYLAEGDAPLDVPPPEDRYGSYAAGERVIMPAWGGEFINNPESGQRRVAYINRGGRDAYI